MSRSLLYRAVKRAALGGGWGGNPSLAACLHVAVLISLWLDRLCCFYAACNSLTICKSVPRSRGKGFLVCREIMKFSECPPPLTGGH